MRLFRRRPQPILRGLVEATTQPCSLHHSHSPLNRTVEFHHLIPVAWQLKTSVAVPPSAGLDSDGRGMLWDNRGAWICPTGHRNVHSWIVEIMHALHDSGVDDYQAAYAKVKPRRAAPAELTTAMIGLTRFAPYGSLVALTRAGEWGQM